MWENKYLRGISIFLGCTLLSTGLIVGELVHRQKIKITWQVLVVSLYTLTMWALFPRVTFTLGLLLGLIELIIFIRCK